MDDLFVDSAFRGQGIAKMLIKKLALIAREHAITRIELWCIKSNDIAQRFYRSLQAEKLDFLDVVRLDVATILNLIAD